jgi:hypothetical protein
MSQELWGCYNRELKSSYQVQDGWTTDGRRVMREHNFVNSVNCVYAKATLTDPKCGNCKHKS